MSIRTLTLKKSALRLVMARGVLRTSKGVTKDVLKITTAQENSESLRVNLYGQFTGEYVPDVEKVLSGQGVDKLRVVLDLSNVTFVDRAAMMFLRTAKSKSIVVENAPSYVMRWIEQENHRGSAHSVPYET